MVNILDIPVSGRQLQRTVPVLPTDVNVTGEIVQAVGRGIESFRIEADKREAAAYVSEQRANLELSQLQRFNQLKTSHEDVDTFTDTFLDAYDTDVENLVENAPNPLAAESIQNNAEALRTRFGIKAIQFQSNQKTAAQKGSLRTGINSRVNTVLSFPDEFESVIQQLDGDFAAAESIMTPAELADFKVSTMSLMAEAKVRAETNRDPFTAEELLDTEEFQAIITPSKMISLRNAIDRKKEALRSAAVKAQNRALSLFQNDPAQLAIENGADPQNPDSIIENQFIIRDGERMQVQPDNISVIPKSQAGVLANGINGTNQPDLMITQLEGLQKKYGEHYPTAMKDLKKAGLSDDALFISFMDAKEDRHLIEASFQIQKAGEKEIRDSAKAKASAAGDLFSELQTSTFQDIKQLSEVMQLENIPFNEINGLLDRSTNLASFFYSKGDTIATAAQKATNWMLDKYSFGDVNKPFRVPRAYNVDDVETGLEVILKNISAEDIAVVSEEAGGEGAVFESLQNDGYFILNPDESGFILMSPLGIPVFNKDEVNLFEVTIEDAIATTKGLIELDILGIPIPKEGEI
jgi:hypothetical protein